MKKILSQLKLAVLIGVSALLCISVFRVLALNLSVPILASRPLLSQTAPAVDRKPSTTLSPAQLTRTPSSDVGRIILSGIPSRTAINWGGAYDRSSGLSEWKGKLVLNVRSPSRVSGALISGKLKLRFDSQLEVRPDSTLRVTSFLIQSNDMTFAVTSSKNGQFETRVGRPRRESVFIDSPLREKEPLSKERAASLEQMMDSFLLLPLLSYKLGAELGVKGNVYPAALPIHGLALSVARHKDVQLFRLRSRDGDGGGPSVDPGGGSTGSPPTRVVSSSGIAGCEGKQPGTQAQECNGMCGPASTTSCTCWDWVCGDCCCHVYCRDHDSDCACGDIVSCSAAVYKYLTGTVACASCNNPGNLRCTGPCPTGQTYCSHTRSCLATGAECRPQCGPGQRYCPGSRRCVRKTECSTRCSSPCRAGYMCYEGRCVEMLQ
jgi:hypothetical protein